MKHQKLEMEMDRMENLKLSQLNDDVEISLEESHYVTTVGKVKREILEMNQEHHLAGDWYTVIHAKWEPSAESMVTNYIEQEQDDMYEDWGEQAIGCISEDEIKQIQTILDKAFENTTVNNYWKYDRQVEIDIFPTEVAKN